jgi:hypothetical protein
MHKKSHLLTKIGLAAEEQVEGRRLKAEVKTFPETDIRVHAELGMVSNLNLIQHFQKTTFHETLL